MLQHARRKRKAHAQCARCAQLCVQRINLQDRLQQCIFLHPLQCAWEECLLGRTLRRMNIYYPQSEMLCGCAHPLWAPQLCPCSALEVMLLPPCKALCWLLPPEDIPFSATHETSKQCNLLLHSCLTANNLVLNSSDSFKCLCEEGKEVLQTLLVWEFTWHWGTTAVSLTTIRNCTHALVSVNKLTIRPQ